MEFVFGFLITGTLFLMLFFLIVYLVISFMVRQLVNPLRPIISQLKDAFKTQSTTK